MLVSLATHPLASPSPDPLLPIQNTWAGDRKTAYHERQRYKEMFASQRPVFSLQMPISYKNVLLWVENLLLSTLVLNFDYYRLIGNLFLPPKHCVHDIARFRTYLA